MMEIKKIIPVQNGIIEAVVEVIFPKWGNFFAKVTVFKTEKFRFVKFAAEPYEIDGKKKYAQKCGFTDFATHKKFEEKFFELYDKIKLEQDVIRVDDPYGQGVPF